MPKTIEFAKEELVCRHLLVAPMNLQPGDILLLGLMKFRLETVQRNCPRIENLNKVFTSYVLVDESGAKHYTRDLGSRVVEVYRIKTPVKWV